jgi:hypothetical protein
MYGQDILLPRSSCHISIYICKNNWGEGRKKGREEGTIGSDFITAYVTIRQVSGHSACITLWKKQQRSETSLDKVITD